MYSSANMRCLCWTNSRDERYTFYWKETHCVQRCIFKVVGFHRMKWLISRILQWADLWRSHHQDWDSHVQSIQYYNTTFGHSDEIQQQYLYTLPCDSFLYIEGRLTMKKKNDQMSTTLGNNCIVCLMKFNMNSTVWRVTATETSELPVPSRTMCQWQSFDCVERRMEL